jgi:hypothetical protein
MAKKNSSEPVKGPARKHCPDCAFYLDGYKMANENGSILFSDLPGMQFHQKSSGTIYDKLGHWTPCHCAAGDQVAAGYKNSEFPANNKACTCVIHNQVRPQPVYNPSDDIQSFNGVTLELSNKMAMNL